MNKRVRKLIQKLMRSLFRSARKREQQSSLGRSLYMMSDGVRFSVKSKKKKER